MTPAKAGRLFNPYKLSFLLAGSYLLIGFVYIILSSSMAEVRVQSVEQMTQLEIIKGISFIAITGSLFFAFSLFLLKRLRAHVEADQLYREAMQEVERKAYGGLIVSAIGHDANNLLSSMTLSFSFLKRKLAQLQEWDKLLEPIEQSLQQLIDLNNHMVQGGRGAMYANFIPCKVSALLHESAGLARIHPSFNRVRLETSIEPEVTGPIVRTVFQQSVLNLLLNAAEAAGTNGRVLLSMRKTDGCVLVSVEDNGPGVSEEDKERILQPFFTTKDRGQGLGLFSVRAGIELHKGTLEIGNSPLGGAAFHMSLPANREDGRSLAETVET